MTALQVINEVLNDLVHQQRSLKPHVQRCREGHINAKIRKEYAVEEAFFEAKLDGLRFAIGIVENYRDMVMEYEQQHALSKLTALKKEKTTYRVSKKGSEAILQSEDSARRFMESFGYHKLESVETFTLTAEVDSGSSSHIPTPCPV